MSRAVPTGIRLLVVLAATAAALAGPTNAYAQALPDTPLKPTMPPPPWCSIMWWNGANPECWHSGKNEQNNAQETKATSIWWRTGLLMAADLYTATKWAGNITKDWHKIIQLFEDRADGSANDQKTEFYAIKPSVDQFETRMDQQTQLSAMTAVQEMTTSDDIISLLMTDVLARSRDMNMVAFNRQQQNIALANALGAASVKDASNSTPVPVDQQLTTLPYAGDGEDTGAIDDMYHNIFGAAPVANGTGPARTAAMASLTATPPTDAEGCPVVPKDESMKYTNYLQAQVQSMGAQTATSGQKTEQDAALQALMQANEAERIKDAQLPFMAVKSFFNARY